MALSKLANFEEFQFKMQEDVVHTNFCDGRIGQKQHVSNPRRGGKTLYINIPSSHHKQHHQVVSTK
jgi:hypothetical protein